MTYWIDSNGVVHSSNTLADKRKGK